MLGFLLFLCVVNASLQNAANIETADNDRLLNAKLRDTMERYSLGSLAPVSTPSPRHVLKEEFVYLPTATPWGFVSQPQVQDLGFTSMNVQVAPLATDLIKCVVYSGSADPSAYDINGGKDPADCCGGLLPVGQRPPSQAASEGTKLTFSFTGLTPSISYKVRCSTVLGYLFAISNAIPFTTPDTSQVLVREKTSTSFKVLYYRNGSGANARCVALDASNTGYPSKAQILAGQDASGTALPATRVTDLVPTSGSGASLLMGPFTGLTGNSLYHVFCTEGTTDAGSDIKTSGFQTELVYVDNSADYESYTVRFTIAYTETVYCISPLDMCADAQPTLNQMINGKDACGQDAWWTRADSAEAGYPITIVIRVSETGMDPYRVVPPPMYCATASGDFRRSETGLLPTRLLSGWVPVVERLGFAIYTGLAIGRGTIRCAMCSNFTIAMAAGNIIAQSLNTQYPRETFFYSDLINLAGTTKFQTYNMTWRGVTNYNSQMGVQCATTMTWAKASEKPKYLVIMPGNYQPKAVPGTTTPTSLTVHLSSFSANPGKMGCTAISNYYLIKDQQNYNMQAGQDGLGNTVVPTTAYVSYNNFPASGADTVMPALTGLQPDTVYYVGCGDSGGGRNLQIATQGWVTFEQDWERTGPLQVAFNMQTVQSTRVACHFYYFLMTPIKTPDQGNNSLWYPGIETTNSIYTVAGQTLQYTLNNSAVIHPPKAGASGMVLCGTVAGVIAPPVWMDQPTWLEPIVLPLRTTATSVTVRVGSLTDSPVRCGIVPAVDGYPYVPTADEVFTASAHGFYLPPDLAPPAQIPEPGVAFNYPAFKGLCPGFNYRVYCANSTLRGHPVFVTTAGSYAGDTPADGYCGGAGTLHVSWAAIVFLFIAWNALMCQ